MGNGNVDEDEDVDVALDFRQMRCDLNCGESALGWEEMVCDQNVVANVLDWTGFFRRVQTLIMCRRLWCALMQMNVL